MLAFLPMVLQSAGEMVLAGRMAGEMQLVAMFVIGCVVTVSVGRLMASRVS